MESIEKVPYKENSMRSDPFTLMNFNFHIPAAQLNIGVGGFPTVGKGG